MWGRNVEGAIFNIINLGSAMLMALPRFSLSVPDHNYNYIRL